MIIRTLSVAIATASVAYAGEESSSRLRFSPPADWQSRVDNGTHLVSLTPPGGNASVTFTASTAFAGTAEEWQREMWNGVLASMKLRGAPQSGRQGEFLTQMGVFNKPDGSSPWICLYTLVKNGRGEAVVFYAAGEKEFFAHLATVNRMIYRVTVASDADAGAAESERRPPVAPAAADPAQPAAPNPSGSGDDRIAGLYLATTRQFLFNAFGAPGSGSWEVRTEFYLLSREGRLFRGRDLPNAPDGDIGRFDYAAAQREAPGNAGTYTVRGDEVVMRLGDAETISARWIAPDTLDIRGTKFKRSIPDRQTMAASSAPQPSAPAAAASRVSVPVLAYAEPADFYRGAETAMADYTSNNVNASLQVYGFRPFAGDMATLFQQTLLRDWIDPRYRESALTGPPEFLQYRIPGATLAFVANFHESPAGVPNERVRLVIVADNSAAIVDIHANNASSWQTIAPAVRAMLESLRVDRKEAAPSVAAGPGPAGAALAGLYLGSKPKYVVNLQRPVGYGDSKLALHYYLFAADGRVYCCYDFVPGPEGDWRRFDFDAAQRDDPVNTGRYTIRGNQLLIQMSAPGSAAITATMRDADSVEIENVKYVREK